MIYYERKQNIGYGEGVRRNSSDAFLYVSRGGVSVKKPYITGSSHTGFVFART